MEHESTSTLYIVVVEVRFDLTWFSVLTQMCATQPGDLKGSGLIRHVTSFTTFLVTGGRTVTLYYYLAGQS